MFLCSDQFPAYSALVAFVQMDCYSAVMLMVREWLIKRFKGPLFFFACDVKLRFLRWMLLPGKWRYAYMQKMFYNKRASRSLYGADEIRDHVVGSYKQQNEWRDYEEYLFKYVDASFAHKTALDFGCGPGRWLVKQAHRFKRLDGVDISEQNIENARSQLTRLNISNAQLYVNNGIDLAGVTSGLYDLVFSSICLQHICVHDIRFNLMKEFYRVLKPSGRISIQMGYGKDSPNSVAYRANNYNALTTNRGCDTRVETPEEVRSDLESIGFTDFEYWIRPTGPGDLHPNWIFFTARKGPKSSQEGFK